MLTRGLRNAGRVVSTRRRPLATQDPLLPANG